MKKGVYQDLERDWRKLKRFRFFYIVLPVFLTMLSVRIIQVYFHLKMEQLKKAAASCGRELKKPDPVPAPAQKAEMEFFTPEPAVPDPSAEAPEPEETIREGSCTVTEEP